MIKHVYKYKNKIMIKYNNILNYKVIYYKIINYIEIIDNLLQMYNLII